MTKTWLITGANSGLGRLTTERLLDRGDRVAALVRRPETLDELASSSGGRLHVFPMDLSLDLQIEDAVTQAHEALGHFDIVVSNAGFGTFGALEELSTAQIRRQIETNLIGSALFIRAVLPVMRTQGGGRILQVTSEGGRISYPGFSTYHASKWGQEGLVEAVSQEVAPYGVEMCLIEPGPTATNFLQGIDMGAPLEDYADSPTAELRAALDSGEFVAPMGDAARMAEEIIALADGEVLPLRVPMGSVAWNNINRRMQERMTLLNSQKDLAFSCDKAE